MKFAIIENNTVVNVAVADSPLAENWIASEVAAIGANGSTTTIPAPGGAGTYGSGGGGGGGANGTAPSSGDGGKGGDGFIYVSGVI